MTEHLTDLVTQTLARDVEKLARANADERHLFLLGRTAPDHEYFARLSDEFDDGYEPVDGLVLPDGVTDVWFRGRAHAAPDKMSGFTMQVARFNRTQGWSRHEVAIAERAVPGPRIVADQAPEGWRSPRSRT
jgi:hypothetical protein